MEIFLQLFHFHLYFRPRRSRGTLLQLIHLPVSIFYTRCNNGILLCYGSKHDVAKSKYFIWKATFYSVYFFKKKRSNKKPTKFIQYPRFRKKTVNDQRRTKGLFFSKWYNDHQILLIVIKKILFIEWYNLSSIVKDDQDVDSCSGMFFHLLVSSWSLLGFEISVSPTLYLPSRSIHIHSVSHVGIVACLLQPNHLLLDELKCQTWVHVHVR